MLTSDHPAELMRHPETAESASTQDVVTALTALAREPLEMRAYLQRSLELLRTHFASPFASASVESPTGSVEETVGESEETWLNVAHASIVDVTARERAAARVFQGADGRPALAILASPVHSEGDEACGAIALCISTQGHEHAKAALTELRSLAVLLGAGLPEVEPVRAAATAEGTDVLRALQKATGFETSTRFAFAITNNLRVKYDCEQVVLSLVQGRTVKVLSISGIDDPKPRVPGTLAMRQAQEECLDLARPLVHQTDDHWCDEPLSAGYRLHRQWHEATGGSCVASIPIFESERAIAILSLRRRREQSFQRTELEEIAAKVAPFGTALAVVRRAERGLLSHTRDRLSQHLGWLLSYKGVGRKLALGAAALFALWFCFGSMSHQLVFPCAVGSEELVQFSAPFEGKIRFVQAEAGEHVTAGTLLCALDTSTLQLRARELGSEIEAIQVEIDQALAVEDIAAAQLALSRRNVSDAQLASVQRQIREAEIRAEKDGTIVSGDLSRRLGQVVPQGEPLFELATDEDLLLELYVDESRATDLVEGAEIRFASNARPEEPLVYRVDRVHPASEIREGRNVFVAEARPTDPAAAEWLRAGMEGVARVDLGDRRVWYVALHRLIDFAHQELWL